MPQDDKPTSAWVPIPGAKPDWPMDVKTQSYAGRMLNLRSYPYDENVENRLEDVLPHLQGQSRMMARAQLDAADAYEKTNRPKRFSEIGNKK